MMFKPGGAGSCIPSSSQSPGTSKQGGASGGGGKRRHNDPLLDVPSDESDDERERTQSKRQRLRNIRTRPAPSRRPSSAVSVVSNSQERMNGMALARRLSSSSSVSVSSNRAPVSSDQQLALVRGSREVGAECIIADYSGANQAVVPLSPFKRRKSVIRISERNGWALLSLWMPSWNSKLKMEDGRFSTEINPNELGKEVLELIEMVMPFIANYKQRRLKIAQVQRTEEDGSGNAEIMTKRCIFRSDPCQDSDSQSEIGTIRLKSSTSMLGKILPNIILVNDLILQFKQNLEEEQHAPVVLIHLATRGYNGEVIQGPPRLFPKIHITVYDSHDFDKFLNIYSLNFKWPSPSTRTKPAIESPSSGSSISSGFAVPVLVDIERNSSSHSSEESLGGGGGAIVSSTDDEILETSDEDSVSVERISTSYRLKGNAEDDSANVISLNNVTNAVDEGLTQNSVVEGENNRNLEFNIDQLAHKYVFLPGPMRPTVHKAGPSNKYTYHKLNKLAEMLNASITADSKSRMEISALIKHHCHAYGVVVKVVQDHRHENSYRIRIADETLNSVLVRLQTSTVVGPKIEVGDIIRIHRLTVQIEWDSELNDNTMVLSSSQHINYVLFRELTDKECTFHFHTCAQSFTFGDDDKLRIAELNRFKKKTLARNREQVSPFIVPSIIPQHRELVVSTININNNAGPSNKDLDTNEVSSSREADDGIYTDDLESPHPSETSSLQLENDDCRLSPILFDDVPQSNPIRLSEGSNGSDDTFITANTSAENITDTEMENAEITRVEASPPMGSDIDDRLQSGEILHLGRDCPQPEDAYTCFANLTKNGVKPTLLCTIEGLGCTADKDMCNLIIRDGECTLPKEDFKNRDILAVDSLNTHLVLNIANVNRLVDTDVLSRLLDSIGGGELYIIKDVAIIGDRPPYSLKVDGDNCTIRLATFEDLTRSFKQTQAFSQANNSITVDREEVTAKAHPRNLNQTFATNATGELLNEISADGDGLCPGVSGDTPTTPNSSGSSQTENKPWDGKVTTKRRRRHHYQAEDSCDC